MINENIVTLLNEQVQKEEFSSRLYLAMAVWCEVNGFPGAATFLYNHAEEERMHQMKLIHYINERGGVAVLSEQPAAQAAFDSLEDIFKKVLEHEEFITQSINRLYGQSIAEQDYTTGNFLQWFITEQVEEESTMRTILDKIKLVGKDKAGMFHIDKELETMARQSSAPPQL
jgi:ferritin